MRTIQEISNMKPIYLHQWNDKIGVIGDFENIYISKSEYEATECPYNNIEYWKENKARMKEAIEKWEPIHILFASYGYENYSGDAWVLFELDGKLYEVNGGHCSCYGLEGQWEPDEVELEELKNRLLNGSLGTDDWSGNTFKKELLEFLGIKL